MLVCSYEQKQKMTTVERVTSIYQPMNAHIISHKTLLKHFKTLRHVSILSDHHQGALFLAKVILQCSQFNSYLQTSCCGSISCCVGMCCGAVARCASYDAHLATCPWFSVTLYIFAGRIFETAARFSEKSYYAKIVILLYLCAVLP